MRAQAGLPFSSEATAPASLADRIARLEIHLAHYRLKESEPYYARGDSDHRNPWTGLRKATERVLVKLHAQREAP